jgi:RNA polymerase sigma factor (sigma-70 family)
MSTDPARLHELPDAELVQRCLGDSQAAWRVLVHRYQRLVFTVARRAGMDEHASADVLQGVFEKVHRHLAQLTQPDRLRAWVVTTAKREALTLRHRASRERSADDAGPDDEGLSLIDRLVDPAPLADERLQDLQEAQRMHVALDRLDERCRRLLTLLFADEDDRRPYDEIARRLDMPEGSIGPTRGRCLDKLRRLYLQGDGGPVPP